MRTHTLVSIAASIVFAWLTPLPIHAGLLFFDLTNGGLAAFNVAADNPPISINFDNIPLETDLNGTTIAGVTFRSSSTGSPLLVVRGDTTFTPGGFDFAPFRSTNRLFPTSGKQVLSPGGKELAPGPNAPLENDDLRLVFTSPVTAFGFDLLPQSADGDSRTRIRVFNQDNELLYDDIIPISHLSANGRAPGRAEFWGAVAIEPDLIGRIVIDELDDDKENPDSNIGFDTFRFFPPASSSGLQGEDALEDE